MLHPTISLAMSTATMYLRELAQPLPMKATPSKFNGTVHPILDQSLIS